MRFPVRIHRWAQFPLFSYSFFFLIFHFFLSYSLAPCTHKCTSTYAPTPTATATHPHPHPPLTMHRTLHKITTTYIYYTTTTTRASCKTCSFPYMTCGHISKCLLLVPKMVVTLCKLLWWCFSSTNQAFASVPTCQVWK